MYVMGNNNYGQLFTQDTTTRGYATPVETDKDILTATITKIMDTNQVQQQT